MRWWVSSQQKEIDGTCEEKVGFLMCLLFKLSVSYRVQKQTLQFGEVCEWHALSLEVALFNQSR
jgi:hypothetical protein